MSFMDFEVEGPVIEWRGPAPFYFLPLKDAVRKSANIELGQVLVWR